MFGFIGFIAVDADEQGAFYLGCCFLSLQHENDKQERGKKGDAFHCRLVLYEKTKLRPYRVCRDGVS